MDDSIKSVKVFSATMVRKREVLGERVTEWIRDNPEIHILKTVIAQSSDLQFHCLSIILFCGEARAKAGSSETSELQSAHWPSPADEGRLPARVSVQPNRKPK